MALTSCHLMPSLHAIAQTAADNSHDLSINAVSSMVIITLIRGECQWAIIASVKGHLRLPTT